MSEPTASKAKNVCAESRQDGIFPGDIGNPERQKNYHDPGEYSNYEFQEGWDLPTKNKDWEISNKRDEVGFGIQRAAQRYLLARKATQMAQCFLGDEAPTSAILTQARTFAKLGYNGIVASLNLWQKTDPLVTNSSAENLPETGECETCTLPPPSNGKVTDETSPDNSGTPSEATKSANTEPATESVEAVTSQVATPPVEPVMTPATEAEANTNVDGEEPEDDFTEVATASTKPVASDPETGPDLNLDIPPAHDDGTERIFSSEDELNQAEADPTLEELFMGRESTSSEPVASVNRVANRKVGIKKIGGQPTLTGDQAFGLKELEGIWSNIKLPTI